MGLIFCLKSVLRESEQICVHETKLLQLTKIGVYLVAYETLLSSVCLQNFQNL